MTYPEEYIGPMRQELETIGFTAAKTADEVEAVMSKEGTTLLIINSVCCNADKVRSGANIALKNDKVPQNTLTVFAGADKEATDKAREYITGEEPSSPSIAFFKDGKLVKFIGRPEILGSDAESVGEELKSLFNEYC